jgi:hypothetical protein
MQVLPMLRLCDCVHLHQTNTKQRGGVEVPCLSIVSDGAKFHPEATKKKEGTKLC